jgi:hypothetical protein
MPFVGVMACASRGHADDGGGGLRAAMNRIEEVRHFTRLAERKPRFAVGYLITCGTVLTLFVVALLR